MGKSTISQYECMKEDVDSTIRAIDERLNRFPEGDLKIWRHGKGFEYCISSKNKDGKRSHRYVSSREEQTLTTYGLKLYLSKLKKALIKESRTLSVMAKTDFGLKGRIYDELPAVIKQSVNPLYTSVEHDINKWYGATFASNPFEFSSAGYETELGEKVRSRAECIIANELKNSGLKYHYEEKLTLAGGKARYPDFKVAHPKSGEFYYIEFFGMMDDPEYSGNAFIKISEYSNDPIMSRMIFIFDHKKAPFTNKIIKSIIKNIFC